MLESPLKRYKRAYPIDFSSTAKREAKQQNANKYDVLSIQDYKSNHSAKYDIDKHKQSESCSNPNPQATHDIKQYKKQKYEVQLKLNSNQNQPSFQFVNALDSINVEKPLQQISKKNIIQMDLSLIANPRFHIKDGQQLYNAKTFQSLSPALDTKVGPGNIKHQNLRSQNLGNQNLGNQNLDIKQQPLLPQNPFRIGYHQKKQKYLQKLGIYSRERINNKSSSQKQYQIQNNIKRANSSFQMRLNNSKQLNISPAKEFFRDNLPNIFSKNSFRFSNFNPQSTRHKQYLKKTDYSQNTGGLNQNTGGIHKDNVIMRNSQSSQFKFQPNIIAKIKQQINGITQRKFQKRNYNQEKKHKEGSPRQYTFNDNQDSRAQVKQSYLANKLNNVKGLPKIQITYHTTLISLKNIVKKYIRQSSLFQLVFKIPKIFVNDDLFYQEQSKQQLHQYSIQLFQALKISAKNMVTKRYSNCILFICQNTIVIWHYNGKRFLGGWQYKYLNEGSKHGLGLQWEPNSHIYYGQFKDNKKHGIGAMKQGGQAITVGYWHKGKYIGQVQNDQSEIDDQQETINDEDWRESTQLSHYGLQNRFNHHYQQND